MPKCNQLTTTESAELIALTPEALADRLRTKSDGFLEELETWAKSWAASKDGARRLLVPVADRTRRVGKPVAASAFEKVRKAAVEEMNRRCWED